MIKIALYDENSKYNTKIKNFIERYRKENSIEIEIVCYYNAMQLLLDYRRRKIDIIFLDAKRMDLDEFELVEKIKECDSDIKIMFCYSHYTVATISKRFPIEEKDLLLKPLSYKKIESILNQVYKMKFVNGKEKLFLKCQDGIVELRFLDIIYVHAEDKKIVIHTKSGRLESSQKLENLEKKLDEELFYRCHKNYIINYKYAFALRTGNIMLMRLEAVPYDKNKRKGFLKGLAKYMGNVVFAEDM